MSDPSTLNADDYENLALVAQGQWSLLSEPCVRRLRQAGLVTTVAASEAGAASVQLTARGLALIRSSDQ